MQIKIILEQGNSWTMPLYISPEGYLIAEELVPKELRGGPWNQLLGFTETEPPKSLIMGSVKFKVGFAEFWAFPERSIGLFPVIQYPSMQIPSQVFAILSRVESFEIIPSPPYQGK